MVESDGSRCMNISLMKCANMMNLLFHLITINVCEMLAWASDDFKTTKTSAMFVPYHNGNTRCPNEQNGVQIFQSWSVSR